MKTLRIAVVATLLLGVGFAGIPSVSHADSCSQTTYVSDTSTQVNGGAATVVSPLSPYWTASIPGATWIWDSADSANPGADVTLTFTRTFSLDAIPSTADMTVTADDLYDVAVNGTPVVANSEQDPFMTIGTVDVSKQLVVGSNTVTFTVTNLEFDPHYSGPNNPGGLLYSLVLTPPCSSSSTGYGSNSTGTNYSYPLANTTPPAAVPVPVVVTPLPILPPASTNLLAVNTVGSKSELPQPTLSIPTSTLSTFASNTPAATSSTITMLKNFPWSIWIGSGLLVLFLLVLGKEIYSRVVRTKK